MNMMTNEDFAAQVLALARPDEAFRARATYDPDGDCIEFLAKPDAFYAERVDDLVTVYYSQETEEVVGSLIKGVSNLLRDVPLLEIVITDGRVKLEHLFLARIFSNKGGMPAVKTLTYQKLIQAAEEADVEAELAFA